MEVSDSLHISFASKWTKIHFITRVSIHEDLVSCEHIKMTSKDAWEPSIVLLNKIRSNRINPKLHKQIQHIHSNDNKYKYNDINCDEAHLHFIYRSLSNLRERLIRQVTKVYNIDEETLDIPTRRKFV